MNTISFSRIQAALRAMGIDTHEEVVSVLMTPKQVTVNRQDLNDRGEPYIDPVTDAIAARAEVFDVDHTKDDADDGTGLTYADVVLVHDDGVVFDFHVVEEVVYLADVAVDGTIDIHLYGKGSASKSSSASSVSEPMPADEGGPDVVITRPEGEATA
ncbi:hypothetical protein Rhe02_54460 [Rhizocola hellebori]|uniref:Uncharacterized protein n=1 Tax=Rhizocola hellebori TaxID=1392758 RepID=A0A8J3QAU6_9ACTN|nr:hypothetical protein [Rhizocola hellebori]GIH07379.1 hypothetical protein Rhe02_54460 [Rhizocola hellebori]